ncbi:hypothetical protein [Streptosporangium sp. NPDC051022]|uniref:hypothetical protein n=1 Tax=Streptosporangium sp. NPDC051022 TaxID=3155752 RepID=UPI003419CDFD
MREYLNHLADDLRAAGFPAGANSFEDYRVRVYDANDDVHVAINTETGHVTIARLLPNSPRDIRWEIDYGNPWPVLTGDTRPAWETRCTPHTPAAIVLAITREAHTLRRFEPTPV